MDLEALVQALWEHPEGLSGEALAGRAGISRAAVWKAIEKLRQLGYEVEGAPKRGYRLLSEPDAPFPWAVRYGMQARTIGCRIEYVPEVGSTNDVARQLAGQGAPEGTVVVADRQTQGRGRRGRAWSSPSGGLWVSLLLRPPVPPSEAAILTTVAAVGLVAGIERATGVVCQIKWPNDLWVHGRKLAGVLTELSAEQDQVRWAVIGMGINANVPESALPEDVRATATSLQQQLGRPAPRAAVLRGILEGLDEAYHRWKAGGIDWVLARARDCSATLGRRVRVDQSGTILEGVAEALERDGSLVLKLSDGQRVRVYAGDVSLRQG